MTPYSTVGQEKGVGQNWMDIKKVVEGLWKKNLGKGILCVIKLAKIYMNLLMLLKITSFSVKSMLVQSFLGVLVCSCFTRASIT